MSIFDGLINPSAPGQAFMAGMERGQKQREVREVRGALSAYAVNPDDPAAFQKLATYRPEFAMQIREDQTRKAAAQRQQQQADAGTFRKLLKQAETSPEGWQQALGAAQSLGLDTSGIPQDYNPQWASQQLFIMDALERPEGAEALSTAGKVAADMGYKPGTPEHAKVTREVFLADAAKPYTGGQGETRLYIPQIGGAGRPAPPQPGTIVGGYVFKGGDPKDRNNYEQEGGADASRVGSNFLDGLPRTSG